MKRTFIRNSIAGLSLLILIAIAVWIVLSLPGWLHGAKPQSLPHNTSENPAIQPKLTNKNSGKKVLFDNTHAETAGSADWVIDGGFSDFADALTADGFSVKELRNKALITYEDLKDYDVFVIGEANNPFKESEHQAMLQYVQNGGSIFFIADHYNADRNLNRWDASEVFNGYRRGAWG